MFVVLLTFTLSLALDKFCIKERLRLEDDNNTKVDEPRGKQISTLLPIGVLVNLFASFYFVGLSRKLSIFGNELLLELLNQFVMSLSIGIFSLN